MKKYFLISMLLCTSIILTGCGNAADDISLNTTIRTVKVQTVGDSGYENGLILSGNVTPYETVKVSFKIAGVISNLNLSEGDFVSAGQSIASLDQKDYKLKADAAQAEYDSAESQINNEIPFKIEQAQAAYDLSKTTYERVKALYESDSVTKAQLDEAETKMKVDEMTLESAKAAKVTAETKLKTAQAQLDGANNTISDTTVTSPISGVILQKLFSTGETVSAGYPVVAVGNIDKVYIEAYVTDENINSIKKGEKAVVYAYGLNKSYEGTVDEISFTPDSTTRTYPVKILVDNKDKELRPGMVTKITLNLNSDSKIMIPVSSIMQFSEGTTVFVYNEETNNVEKRKVTTGEICNDKIEITEGLTYGEKLITKGQFVLDDGETVNAEED